MDFEANNFKYPEFIEMEWTEPVSISRIEISFDPSYEFIYPEQPQTFRDDNFHSLVKEYKIYTSMSAENAELIIHQKENNLPFVSHVFDPLKLNIWNWKSSQHMDLIEPKFSR